MPNPIVDTTDVPGSDVYLYNKGYTVVTNNDTGDVTYMYDNGTIDIYTTDANGKQMVRHKDVAGNWTDKSNEPINWGIYVAGALALMLMGE